MRNFTQEVADQDAVVSGLGRVSHSLLKCPVLHNPVVRSHEERESRKSETRPQALRRPNEAGPNEDLRFSLLSNVRMLMRSRTMALCSLIE